MSGNKRLLRRLRIAACTALLLVMTQIQLSTAQTQASLSLTLPEPKAHPLPALLAQWQDPNNNGDYFSQVNPTTVGFLVWSQFPIKVYIEAVSAPERKQQWQTAVLEAVQEWKAYLPLVVVNQVAIADITIKPVAPPLRVSKGNLPRSLAAETRYELYNNKTATASVLSHRCTIWLSPNQTSHYLQASARHELGHALGIWGHSPNPRDALYFSQVRNPAFISARDVNTLKRIYQQPTRLGWQMKG